ncbi:protein-tyrosine phosphatase family protein [Sinorhizobium fredii]|uniref:protein-tyrosine phosphatase family protein n=1 Tax=Rhizobium fredii TaxID=380 RepID=UPI001294CDB4|nr:hypothetical protein [Sinorhizobium fredii]MQW94027.1 hypothetical protein [Sinorhizobium fredii]
MKRKNLDDVIYGDRAAVRAAKLDLFGDGGGSGSFGSKSSKYDDFSGRCFAGHPALKLPGSELLIYGGSCLTPAVKDADIYIGFDAGMRFTERHWPWKKGSELLFKVPDMGVPEKPEEYKKLLAWTRKQLDDGKKVHCGCIGGHGRTGMFLAALVASFGEKDAVSYVREHYCHKSVESRIQIQFLCDHFGVKKVGGSKEKQPATSKKAAGERYQPVRGHGCIWDA